MFKLHLRYTLWALLCLESENLGELQKLLSPADAPDHTQLVLQGAINVIMMENKT